MSGKTGLLLTVLACALCYGQIADDSQPASTNVTDAEYPRIHSDLRVTFRLEAPDEKEVQVRLGQIYVMVKDGPRCLDSTTTGWSSTVCR